MLIKNREVPFTPKATDARIAYRDGQCAHSKDPTLFQRNHYPAHENSCREGKRRYVGISKPRRTVRAGHSCFTARTPCPQFLSLLQEAGPYRRYRCSRSPFLSPSNTAVIHKFMRFCTNSSIERITLILNVMRARCICITFKPLHIVDNFGWTNKNHIKFMQEDFTTHCVKFIQIISSNA